VIDTGNNAISDLPEVGCEFLETRDVVATPGFNRRWTGASDRDMRRRPAGWQRL